MQNRVVLVVESGIGTLAFGRNNLVFVKLFRFGVVFNIVVIVVSKMMKNVRKYRIFDNQLDTQINFTL